MKPYRPRPIQPLGLWSLGEWKLKRYGISAGGRTVGPSDVEATHDLVRSVLPLPAVTASRPGAGIVLLHRGEPREYLVVAWWDQENELPHQVFVRDYEPEAAWRPAASHESICVWDLEVLWFEREAYVDTVLRADGGGVEAYCRRFAARAAEGTA